MLSMVAANAASELSAMVLRARDMMARILGGGAKVRSVTRRFSHELERLPVRRHSPLPTDGVASRCLIHPMCRPAMRQWTSNFNFVLDTCADRTEEEHHERHPCPARKERTEKKDDGRHTQEPFTETSTDKEAIGVVVGRREARDHSSRGDYPTDLGIFLCARRSTLEHP